MHKFFRIVVLAGLAAGLALPAAAGELTLTMANGRVTLIAQDVPLRQILAEWARVGQTRIVNAEKLMGPPVTLRLVDQPEGVVLELLLRSAAGYMAAPRPASQPGVSVYDRIMILATSRAPAVTNTPPPAFANRPMPQPAPQPAVDDDNGVEQGPVPPPGVFPPGVLPPGMQQPGGIQFPGQTPPGQQQPVLTSPRPGPLPQPQQPAVPGTVNPYAPGVIRPPPAPRPGGGPGEPDRN